MTLDGLKLIFLSGETVSEETLKAVTDLVRKRAKCVLPTRLAPKDSDFNTIHANTLVPDAAGQWLIVPEFYRLHYETFCAGPVNPLLWETFAPLIVMVIHWFMMLIVVRSTFDRLAGIIPAMRL